MSFFNFFHKKSKHSQDCLDAYERLKDNKFCKFYLRKIPKYCSIDKILWIEAGIIENDIVYSFRINYFHEKLEENVDKRVDFKHYGHSGLSVSEFRDFMRYLSVALAKEKFIFVQRGYDACLAGCLYDRKYAKKMFSLRV